MKLESERRGGYLEILADVRSRRIEPRSVAAAALIAGLVFLVVEMVGRELAHDTTAFTTPVRIASLLLGEEVTRSNAPAGLLVLALVLHAMLSLVYGLMICLAVQRLPIRPALFIGGLLGAVIYVVNHYVLTPLFPAFAAARGGIALVAHLAFGVTAVAAFAALRRRRIALAARAPSTARARGVTSRSTG
jgi:hypothetical protein